MALLIPTIVPISRWVDCLSRINRSCPFVSNAFLTSPAREVSGRLDEVVIDRHILAVFDDTEEPVLTTGEVATGLQRLGIDTSANVVRQRLERMEARGAVSGKRIGRPAVAWWTDVGGEIELKRDADEWIERSGSPSLDSRRPPREGVFR